MVVNPNGMVLVSDGGNPRIITGRAREVISGGQFVFASGTEDVVNSGLASLINTDIQFATAGSGITCNGVALQTVGSNEYVAILRQGDVIVAAGGILSGGQPVQCNGGDAVVAAVGSQAHGWAGICGRTITGATSGAYSLVGLNF